MMPNTCKRLTIFEGPDGAGKTTTAKQFASDTNAVYVHFPQLPRVDTGLARMYVESMLPALLGYQDVVFDRSWLSELPYGQVFREGQDRLGNSTVRMLERLAMRCDTMVILCLPEFSTVVQNYRSRKHLEMLDSVEQLVDVFNIYSHKLKTSLPVMYYDYEYDIFPTTSSTSMGRTIAHHLDVRSAGNMRAKIALVGDQFAERKNDDPFYQWPFASFSNEGCSRWLTKQLDFNGIGEDNLYWINSDQILSLGHIASFDNIITLGANARLRVEKLGLEGFFAINHPQYEKRFGSGCGELISLLKGVVHD